MKWIFRLLIFHSILLLLTYSLSSIARSLREQHHFRTQNPILIYFKGMKREECVAPIPGLPCLTGLLEHIVSIYVDDLYQEPLTKRWRIQQDNVRPFQAWSRLDWIPSQNRYQWLIRSFLERQSCFVDVFWQDLASRLAWPLALLFVVSWSIEVAHVEGRDWTFCGREREQHHEVVRRKDREVCRLLLNCLRPLYQNHTDQDRSHDMRIFGRLSFFSTL